MSLFDLNEEQMKDFSLDKNYDDTFTIKETDVRVIGIDIEDEVLAVVPYFSDRIGLDELREITWKYEIIPFFGKNYWKGKLEITWESDEEWALSLINGWIDEHEILVLKRKRFDNIEVYKKITS